MKKALLATLVMAAIPVILPARAQEPTRGERREALQAARQAALTTDPGVVIGSLRWATRNVDEPGRFTLRSRDRGRYFSHEEALTACPAGWRAPTIEELETLVTTPGGWARVGGTDGWMFTGERGETLYLPAAGFRGTDGSLGYIWELGTYQSATPVDEHGATQGYVNHGLIFNRESLSRSNSMTDSSLRCVFDQSAVPPPVPPTPPVLLAEAPAVPETLPTPPVPETPPAPPAPPAPVGLMTQTPVGATIAYDPGTGLFTTPSIDSLQMIDPVTVTAQRQQRVNVGYGSLAPELYAGNGNIVDMSRAHLYPDIITFLPGHAGPGVHVSTKGEMSLIGHFNLQGGLPMMIIVDGVPFDGGVLLLNEIYPLSSIESIFFDKVGTIYGSRGAGGVMVVTTKGYR